MGKRILVADDSLTIQKAFSMVLSGQDYTLLFARSADEAVAAARGARPDLVYADVAMGSGNGYDLCASIKNDPGLRGVPVYILASSQNPYDQERAQRVGADGSFPKPFDSQALLDGVAAALKAPSVVAPGPGYAAPAPVVLAPTRPAPASSSAPMVPGSVTQDIGAEDTSDPDDSYGEFTIERSSPAPAPGAARTLWPPTPGSGARVTTPPLAAAVSPNRPSLIPGVAPPSAQPTPRSTPSLPGVIPAPAASVPRPAATRTIMGFPSGGSQPSAPPAQPPKPIVPRPGVPFAAPAAPRPAPPPPPAVSPLTPVAVPSMQTRTGAPGPSPQTVPAPVAAAVSSVIDQKVAAIAARGKEYEAIAKLSREIIEQVVWEVVPELAEVIIKQEIDRLVAAKR